MQINSKKRKNIIIGILMVLVVVITIGYSVLSSRLTINGTSSITSDFNVLFTDIQEGLMNEATTVNKKINGPTTATFQVDLKKPGSNAEYIVTVENQGKIDATLESIEGITEANEKTPTYITFSLEGIKEGDALNVSEIKTFKVKVTYNESATEIPEESKQLTLKLNYVQKTNSGSGGSSTDLATATNTLLENSAETYNYLDGTYLKGTQDSNYVWFNGFMWRIMGANADGSIRMITEENVTTIPWGEDVIAQNYDNSYVNDWLNNYFYPKLKNKEGLLMQTWCSEATTDETSARTTCQNNLSNTLKYVGLISLDEFNLANGKSSYLHISQFFWTITQNNINYIWSVDAFSKLRSNSIASVNGVRPVINISSEISITDGNGTPTDPYMFEDKSSSITGTLKDNSGVGEYVTYAGRNYRVVETSENGTKLILDGYYDSNNDGTIEEIDQMIYGENCALCSTLNEDNFIHWLSNNNETEKNKLSMTTWYRGDYWTGGNYKTNLESTANPYDGSVGLIRVGEMLAGQSETILSKNHTMENSMINANHYLTLTPNGLNDVWIDNILGHMYTDSINNNYAIRPVINIAPDVQITSGNGTFNSPYQI